MSELVPVELVAYEDNADLEQGDVWRVDELKN